MALGLPHWGGPFVRSLEAAWRPSRQSHLRSRSYAQIDWRRGRLGHRVTVAHRQSYRMRSSRLGGSAGSGLMASQWPSIRPSSFLLQRGGRFQWPGALPESAKGWHWVCARNLRRRSPSLLTFVRLKMQQLQLGIGDDF